MGKNLSRLLNLEKRIEANEEEQKRPLSPTEIMKVRSSVMNYKGRNYTENLSP